MSPSASSRRLWLGLGLLAVLAEAALAFLHPPDGTVRGTLPQFFGRFHPAIVHLPVALVLLVPMLEIAARFSRGAHLRAATGFVLGLAAVTAVIAAFDGWLLAWSGGYGGRLVVRHLWGGVGLAAACVLLAGWRPRGVTYVLAQVAVLVLLVWTTDQGGQISHGTDYLSEYLPARLRPLFRLPPVKPKPPPQPVASAATATFYAQQVVPILQQSCISCHGPKKVKGGLRMDSYSGLMHGGEDGPAVIPWKPSKSEMVRRITLPSDDDDFMPSGGKKPLTAAEIQTLVAWIAAGASDKEPADASK